MLVLMKDGNLYLHHIDSHRNVLDLSVLGLCGARFTADGNKIVSISPEGIARVLDGTPWEE